MSLKGTLETVALPEVLHLLADTSKTGELDVVGARVDGQLWFQDGRLCGFEVGRSRLSADALFELLRVESGDFEFRAGTVAPERANRAESGPEEIRPLLDTVQARLAEWPSIVSVVPSLDHGLHLAEESPGDEVLLERSQWHLVVAIGHGRSVGEVLAVRDLPEFDGCKAVKELVDSGLAVVVDAGEISVAPPVAAEVEPVGSDHAHEVLDTGTVEAADDAAGDKAGEKEAPAVEPVAEAEPVVEVEPAVEVEPKPVVKVEAEATVAVSDEEAAEGAKSVFTFGGEKFVFDDEMSEPASESSPVELAPAEVLGGRSALQDLAAAIASDVDHVNGNGHVNGPVNGHVDGNGAAGDPPVAVDGLEDRGPWTSNELSSLQSSGSWFDADVESAPVSSPIVPAGLAAFHPGSTFDPPAPPEEPEGYENGGGQHFEAEVNGGGQHFEADVAQLPADSHEAGSQAESEETDGQSDAVVADDEPLNRGMLLKFLSSVRN